MRFLAIGGIAGPVLFWIVVLASASLRPGYDPVSQFISELGARGTPHAAFMNYAGFVPAGVLLAAFGLALRRALPGSPLASASTILVMLFGCGVATSGVVSCDPGCPQSGGSFENLLHNVIGPVSFLCLIAAAGLLGFRVRGLPGWQPLRTYSFATSGVALGLLLALASSLEARIWTGLWQRLLIATLFLWCAVLGFKVFRTTRKDTRVD